MSGIPQPQLSPAEYLAIDRASTTRHEYVDGVMVAMSGGSGRHSIIISELARLLGNELVDRDCTVTVTELRLQVAQGESYLFPDLMVICGQFVYSDGPADTVTNPTVIVEVLSGSTEKWDRVGKFARYRQLETLQEYVLVSQEELCIEWYTRGQADEWIYHAALGPEYVLYLHSLNITVPLPDIYRRADRADS